MSAPIDDLLYGGDDSGDEEDMNTVSSGVAFSTTSAPIGAPLAPPMIPSTTGSAPIGMARTLAVPSTAAPSTSVLKTAPQPMRIPSAPNTSGTPVNPTPVMQPGSGHQMFQQMFALLKQMLPAEQYAALHSEMRNGNGNDIKSIVDIIKRIAGDAIFATVIQRMNLTRDNSAAAGSLGIIKPEPVVTNPNTNVNIRASIPMTTVVPPTQSTVPTIQRPSLVAPGAATVKHEAVMAATNPTTSGKTDTMEKIQFAKKLLFHASTCALAQGICPVKKCDDVRRVFKHSVSCNGARGCGHCKQLRALVEYHSKECSIAVGEHCKIPFCNGIRLANSTSGTIETEDEDPRKKLNKAKSPNSTTPPPVAGTVNKKKVSTPVKATTHATQDPKPKPNLTHEYGRLLQLILHVEKCKTSSCEVGEECTEAKTLLRQINQPNPPARAETYKKVYAHHKVCVAKNNTSNCPVCKIGLMPIVPIERVDTTISMAPIPMGSNQSPTLKRSNSFTGASPSKKSRTGNAMTSTGKPSKSPNESIIPDSADTPELAAATPHDLRKEEDLLTHTSIDWTTERRIMMMDNGKQMILPEHLACKKEQWIASDLFQTDVLTAYMAEAAARMGVSSLGPRATDVMAYAVQEYLKQVMEELIEISKQRSDEKAQLLEQVNKRDRMIPTREVNSTDLLRLSCDESFQRIRQADLMLRSHLLEEAQRDELAEKERAKKRKKIDRIKVQEEKEEHEMDLEELATKDLKERLLHEEKTGTVRVEGRVNESISTKFIRRMDHQITIQDAQYWLDHQRPYVPTKLFVRMDAARIVTKSLI